VKVGYLIPEFPGQTHIWMWREISHLREWNVPIVIFSTRRPSAQSRARHAFAAAAQSETTYLWPRPAAAVIASLLWAIARHPLGFLKAAWLGLTLPVDRRPAARTVFPLLAPACILARACAQRQITRLHSHTCSNSAILCMMVKRILGLPFSMTLNANIEWWGGAMGQKFADADFTIAITQWLLEQIHRDYPNLAPSQALLGRIGVDTRRWQPDASASDTSPDGTIRLITVGRLHFSKGHDVLLRAVRILADQGHDVSLRLAGAGPEADNLRRLATELGLADRVHFLGSLSEDQIIAELKTADVFVLASHAEPLGVVYMEAMAMGVPTIGTNAGGVGEIITNGVDGILVSPNDPTALADSIAALMSDEARRRQLGEAGRAKIVRCFDSRLGAATLYERLFNRPPPCESAIDSPGGS
jgi:glycosyltransferase involved in cell wall biosynthesis